MGVEPTTEEEAAAEQMGKERTRPDSPQPRQDDGELGTGAPSGAPPAIRVTGLRTGRGQTISEGHTSVSTWKPETGPPNHASQILRLHTLPPVIGGHFKRPALKLHGDARFIQTEYTCRDATRRRTFAANQVLGERGIRPSYHQPR